MIAPLSFRGRQTFWPRRNVGCSNVPVLKSIIVVTVCYYLPAQEDFMATTSFEAAAAAMSEMAVV